MSEPVRIQDASGRIRLVPAAPQSLLSHVLLLEGLWPKRAFCAGLGRCGLCAVRFLAPVPDASSADHAALLAAQVDAGWRLACRQPALPGLYVELPFIFPDQDAPPRLPLFSRKTHGMVTLAIDLGTTSLHWRYDDEAGFLDQGQDMNPQLAAGSEVMSRLGFALKYLANAQALQDMALNWIRPLVEGAFRPVEGICVAGNSVMTALLLGWPLRGLAAAPYILPHPGGFWTSLDSHWPDVYIPPLAAPFIGGDLSAGLAHVHTAWRGEPGYPFLLADMGTNGEFILALGPQDYFGASVPLGPALEGIGTSLGSAALPGVWVDFRLTPGGLLPVALPGEAAPGFPGVPRISGTGYLSLLARLRQLGLLDDDGRFVRGATPLARGIGLALEESATGRRLALGHDAYLTGLDVEELLKVKAAFSLAFSRLLTKAGLASTDLKAVYLAGALGEHVHLDVLEELGFVPPGMKGRMHALGNTSLAGAALLARSGQAREWIQDVIPKIHTLSIGQEDDFFNQYLQRLTFAYVP